MKIARRILLWMFFILTPIIVYGLFLWGYASGELDNLEAYARSLEGHNEVESVLEISRFSGKEFYIVARVALVDESEFYYFISDEQVSKYLDAADVIGSQAAKNLAANVATGEILDVQLGLYLEDPIYEVKMRDADDVHYVIVHALTGDIILYFVN